MLFILADPSIAARNQVDRTGTGSDRFQYTPDESKRWKESPTGFPAWPLDGDLLPLPAQRNDTVRVFVDAKSISRGRDGVSRMTVVVQAESGSRSVFFDGIRCDTREFKTYAIGTVDQKFRAKPASTWQFIERIPLNGFRYTLFDKYACDGSTGAEPSAFVEALKPN